MGTQTGSSSLAHLLGRSDTSASTSPQREAKENPSRERVLVIDNEPDECEILGAALERLGFDPVTETSAEAALERVAREDFGAVLTDVTMGPMDGLSLCERVVGTKPDLPVVLVTGHASVETAIDAIRAGAFDFLLKPVDPPLLGISVVRAVNHRRVSEQVRRLRSASAEISVGNGDFRLIGTSPSMRRIHDLVARVGDSEASVLIHGETGTGKELVARALHAHSPRHNAPFVAINCAAVPSSLLESELFGHARGAFTDAKTARPGLFVQANGGTLFLDEIGELPLETQPKLLRALQERKVRPVGSDQEVSFDARIVAATNRDLETEVAERRFREDLYYRINVVRIALPPLRERGTDVLELAQFLLDKIAARSGKPPLRFPTAVATRLMAYDWPGNVREVENCMERAVALARFDQITLEDLPDRIRFYHSDRYTHSPTPMGELLTVDELERRYLIRVLKLVSGNKSRAAQLLGLDRRTLYRKLERYAQEEKPRTASAEARPSSDVVV